MIASRFVNMPWPTTRWRLAKLLLRERATNQLRGFGFLTSAGAPQSGQCCGSDVTFFSLIVFSRFHMRESLQFRLFKVKPSQAI